ncbi:MAG: radical SAM/Cys-rich domain protein [Bacteroidetes bacterium]|jgi:radical SAM/Cys-rich protein|nr:radical SAM/Cys-rich domain protein [Bacteroidota bacterium]MBV6461851.1 hypothetical protein [Flavobacteriales bacterium]WKZ74421.1 MAG: arsenosugar biosynthesis radical SAM protein ArsS [Vicingaceae bacterium]MCL4816148.1 arsenosugar biosynthesis radical SAM protein ArsS [Flavobacteriales bacterium]NOG95034.1 radical SAM/Cys-rich domain protein [Bacteroidota bacterium]
MNASEKALQQTEAISSLSDYVLLEIQNKKIPSFFEVLKKNGNPPPISTHIDVFQVNLGYLCNQTCKHCHVEAGPSRKEIMSKETMQVCLDIIKENAFRCVDITGGAPEMNPHFRWFVEEIRKTKIKELIVRCNLTIILANANYHDLPEFFKNNSVHIVSSLPFYNALRTDRQRGNGVFEKSIQALQMLNKIGYGIEKHLILDLVYNPNGAFLSANQKKLEEEYKTELFKTYNISFHHLIAIHNMPINRFLEYLINSGNYEDYMSMLVSSYNPETLNGLMCKNTISVAWNGNLYDCDFNQMLQLPLTVAGQTLFNFNINHLKHRQIATGKHCFGCTAGSGSSCQGSLTE